jgi:DNA-binding response OmpR family regulator
MKGEPFELQGTRVLVADDDAAMRRMVTTALCRHGLEVYEAESGEELLWATQSMVLSAWPWDGFDLLITDLRMPGLSGLDVLRKLRESSFTGPVVLMTAFPDAAVASEAARLRSWLLPKPFSLASLSTLVLALLEPSLDDRDLHHRPAN